MKEKQLFSVVGLDLRQMEELQLLWKRPCSSGGVTGQGPDSDPKRGFLDLMQERIQGESTVQTESKFIKKVKE